ncbi:MAG: peptide chain release factor N(5)-glutamine methyltransferase [Balneolales bacterium]
MAQPPENWSVVNMLNWGTDYFKEKNIVSPRLSIEWLLADVLGIKRLDLYMQFDRPLTTKELGTIKPLILRRAKHEPLQYITGQAEFFNTIIKVTRDTLIPRPETEQLVETILAEHNVSDSLRVLDVGTGSGCIALAIKKERPTWEVNAMEISLKALEVAKSNAELNNLDISFIQGDLYNWENCGLTKGYDLVVSNPPYITESERNSIEEQVINYEPELALFTQDINSTYSALIAMGLYILKPKGKIYFETNENYNNDVLELFNSAYWTAKPLSDYSGKKRFIRGLLSGNHI